MLPQSTETHYSELVVLPETQTVKLVWMLVMLIARLAVPTVKPVGLLAELPVMHFVRRRRN